MIYVGTSGWSYPTGEGRWDGIFYPPGKKVDQLEFYAGHFNAVEVNSTFYRPASPHVVKNWAKKTPPEFRFAVKLYQKFTHPKMFQESTGKEAEIDRDDFEQFRAGVEPLLESAKLGCLLAQFPPSFKHGDDTIEYLDDLARQFDGYPLAVELRHRSWTDNPDTFRLLAEHDAAWCIIDEPKFRTSVGDVPLTSKLGYFRFHGRNARQWWTGGSRDPLQLPVLTRGGRDPGQGGEGGECGHREHLYVLQQPLRGKGGRQRAADANGVRHAGPQRASGVSSGHVSGAGIGGGPAKSRATIKY